jgi:2,3-bisphosphoglycerate-independent phosphoglycerate mutase
MKREHGRDSSQTTSSSRISGKIVYLVLDGLGGLPHEETGRTELETARTPNLDRLAGARRWV